MELWYNKNDSIVCSRRTHDLANQTLELGARHHDKMTATLAFQAEIHTSTQDFPLM